MSVCLTDVAWHFGAPLRLRVLFVLVVTAYEARHSSSWLTVTVNEFGSSSSWSIETNEGFGVRVCAFPGCRAAERAVLIATALQPTTELAANALEATKAAKRPRTMLVMFMGLPLWPGVYII